MAEATDRPTAPGETAPAPPAPPAPAGIPPASDVPFGGAEHREAYQPLSLLAIAGLVLAVLYGVVVCLGGVVAFYTRYRLSVKIEPVSGESNTANNSRNLDITVNTTR